jgi:ParB/RepB/Spo0J family partition protein
MKLEFHQLDRRYEHLRARNPERQRRLLASLAASGQQTPIVVVVVSEKPDRYLVIDGYKRIAALEQLGRDTVDAIVWDMNEADALVLDRSMRFSEQETALEQGWLLQELEQRFGYTLEDLARRFDRSVSWVSRRLALVEQLPEAVQQQVRAGEISAHVAMKYLAPVARANRNDCQRMADAFSKYHFSSRQAGELYAAWRDASPSIRQRILDSPELFLKAHQQVSPQPDSPAEQLLRDLTMVLAITNQASRRLARAAPLMGRVEFEAAHRKIECAVRDLTHLAERIEKEQEHVEPKSTGRDSGAALSGHPQTRDCARAEDLTSERTQSPAVELLELTRSGSARESRSLPGSDPGVVGHTQEQSRPGP